MENHSRLHSTFIPLEFWPEILKRLPTKTLCRFRCVCKTWNSLIRSRHFIAAHHATTTTAGNSHLFVQIGYSIGNSHLSSSKHLLIDLEPLESGLNFLQPSLSGVPYYVGIVAYADGVLLGSVRLGREIHYVLCNPAIHRYVFLPEPVSVPGSRCCQLGLGFVPSKNDIGVVKINNDLDWESRQYRFPPIVKVCYARERVWKTIAPDLASTYLLSPYPNINCCVNGRVHWVVQARYENSRCVPGLSEHLLVFDFESERFETLDLPGELVKDMRWQSSRITLLSFKQNLSVLFHGSKNYSVWSMTAYPDVSSWAKLWSSDTDVSSLAKLWSSDTDVSSWSKLRSIGIVSEKLFTVLAGWKADYKLIVSRDKENVMRVYDPDVGDSNESCVFSFEGMSAHNVWGFDESLLLSDEEMNALPLSQIQSEAEFV